MRKRNVVVRFRLSESEYAALTEKVEASGLNRNAFLVRMVRQQTIYPAEKLSELNEKMDVLLAQIRGMGTNLNQIAKIANIKQDIPSMDYLKALAKAMGQFATAIQPVWNEIREALYGNR